MLQYGTVEPRTLDVLKQLMSIEELSPFTLAGGTALALYYGHRLSIDLDLFSNENFDSDQLISVVSDHFSDFTYHYPNAVGVFGYIDGIKTDFARYHHHASIEPPTIEENIRLMSIADIMAMKVSAILKRAVKKDFFDIAELLERFTVDEIINNYNKKYPNHQLLISIPQALTYFSEAEESEDPVSLNGATWDSVKNKIQLKVNEYLQ